MSSRLCGDHSYSSTRKCNKQDNIDYIFEIDRIIVETIGIENCSNKLPTPPDTWVNAEISQREKLGAALPV
jgi:hypothetical protein